MTVPNGMWRRSRPETTMPATRAHGRKRSSPKPTIRPGIESTRMSAVTAVPMNAITGAAISASEPASMPPMWMSPEMPPRTTNTMSAARIPKAARAMWRAPSIFTCCAM
jgi:hypothetical protein